jgi:putative ABC transport system permease protein
MRFAMQTLLRDLLYGLRIMARNPGITALAVLALALGIGANTAIFSLVNAVLLRPLPFAEPDRLMQVWGSTPSKGVPFHFVFYSDLVVWREKNRSFETLAGWNIGSSNLILGDEPERVDSSRVNPGFFTLFGPTFLHGRGFAANEDAPGAAPVAVLSYNIWQRRFASDPKVVGSAINLDGVLHTVVGVLPSQFQIPGWTLDIFVPLAQPEANRPGSNTATVGVYGRLRPGFTKAQAQAEMNTIGASLLKDFPGSLGGTPKVWGLREFLVRNIRLSLFLLLAAVGLVLLIACVNVANLLLARAAARQREVAVRTSLGASRLRLIRQMLTESSLLGLSGGVIGVLLAFWGVKALIVLVPDRYPLVKDAGIDGRVLLFTLAVSLAAGMLFGLAPAFAASKAGDLTNSLKEGGKGESAGSSLNRMLSLLVVVEVALALILLVGSGLMIRGFLRLNAVDPGFRTKGVLTASINLPRTKYSTAASRNAFYRELLLRLTATSGVRAAGVVSILPLTGSNTGTGLIIEGRPIPRREEIPIVWFRTADEGYFKAMDIPLLKGRLFTAQDANGPPVAIINSTLARRFWPGEDPTGRKITNGLSRPGQPTTWMTIVGIVGDLHHMDLEREADAEIFWPYEQHAPGALSLAIRTDSDPTHFAPLLRSAVMSIDKGQPVSQIRSMEQILTRSIAPRRFAVVVLGIFASVALVLAAIGIYGVVSFSVNRRTREIGVRMALGAQPDKVLRMVLGRAVALALSGVGIGLVGAIALTRVIRSLLYGVSATDPLVLGAVAVVLTAVAAFAGFFPARRAAHVDPIEALRNE